MRIGYENGIIEDQLLASAPVNLNFGIANVLTEDMTTKYKSLGSESLLISMRDDSITGDDAENTWDDGFQVKSTTPDSNDNFGRAVAVDGHYMVIGAPSDEETTPVNIGSIHIFRREDHNTNSWEDVVRITPDGLSENDHFGSSVDIEGDYIIVGASDYSSFDGAVWIYHRTGVNEWDDGVLIEADVSHGLTSGALFGGSVAISGDYAIVGVPEDDSAIGTCIIYHRTGTNTWDIGTRIDTIVAGGRDKFGFSVGISGDYAIVGEPHQDSDVGSVYIFHRLATTTWDSGVEIQASDKEDGDTFGFAVGISGDYAVAGAPKEDTGGADIGAAYIFHRTGTNTWDTGFKVQASDGVTLDLYGNDVAIHEDYVAVGATANGSAANINGTVYVYIRDEENTWINENILLNSLGAPSDNFGLSIDLSEGYIAIGSSGDDDDGNNAGSAFAFRKDRATLPITASMCCINAHNLSFGDAVTLNGYEFKDSTEVMVSHTFTFQEYGMAVIFDEVAYFWEIALTVRNKVEIGGIFLGTHLITPAYEIGAKTNYEAHDTFSISGSGQLFGDEGYTKRRNNWLFPWITEDEKEEWLTLFNAVGTSKAFYLLQFPDRQDIQPVIYCHFTSKIFKLEEHEGNRSVYKDVPISTEEVF